MWRASSGWMMAVTLVMLTACSSDDHGSGSGGAGGQGGTGAVSSGGSSGSAGASGTGGAGGSGGVSCAAARDALIGPIDAVSSGGITLLAEAGNTKTVLVDATAGGFAEAKNNPFVYVRLSDVTAVAITDLEAFTSSEWDIALKRDVIRTNSADSGSGSGGAARLSEPFADVDAPDVASVTFDLDEFLDDQCEAATDPAGKPLTAFSDWYDYDSKSMSLAPKPITFIVRAASGQQHYKLEIVDYYFAPEAGPKLSASYTLRIAPL